MNELNRPRPDQQPAPDSKPAGSQSATRTGDKNMAVPADAAKAADGQHARGATRAAGFRQAYLASQKPTGEAAGAQRHADVSPHATAPRDARPPLTGAERPVAHADARPAAKADQAAGVTADRTGREPAQPTEGHHAPQGAQQTATEHPYSPTSSTRVDLTSDPRTEPPLALDRSVNPDSLSLAERREEIDRIEHWLTQTPGSSELRTQLERALADLRGVDTGRQLLYQPPHTPERTSMRDMLPPSRTDYEARMQKEGWTQIKDEATGGITHYYKVSNGVVTVRDLNGDGGTVSEIPGEYPALSPLDLGGAAKSVLRLLGTATLKAAAVVLFNEGVTIAAKDEAGAGARIAADAAAASLKKVAASDAVKLEGRAGAAKLGEEAGELGSAAGKSPAGARGPRPPDTITPPSRQLPPHVEIEPPVSYAKNANSVGEQVVEREVLDNFLPHAWPMSNKAGGFDAFENARTVSAVSGLGSDGKTLVIEQRIAGGDWIQIKGVGEARPGRITENVNTALERAWNGLGRGPDGLQYVKANLFERTAPGTAYRTAYAAPPDRITIFLKLQNGSVTKELVDAAKAAINNSVYKADLPPVRVVIAGR